MNKNQIDDATKTYIPESAQIKRGKILFIMQLKGQIHYITLALLPAQNSESVTIGYLHSSYVLHTADRGQMFLQGQGYAIAVQDWRFYPRSCVASLLDLKNSTSCHLLTASQPSHQPSDPAQLGVSSAPAGVPRPGCSLLAALYSDHQMTLPLWKLGLLLPNPFDENFVCAISRQKPNYSSHVPQGRFYELSLGLSRSSSAGPGQKL